MTIDELITSADGVTSLRMTDVAETASTLRMSVADVFDLFARTVAERFCRGDLPWEVADAAMNSLFGCAYPVTGIGLPAFAFDVYSAFDEGEYVHHDDEPDGEARTLRMLKRLIPACRD